MVPFLGKSRGPLRQVFRAGIKSRRQVWDSSVVLDARLASEVTSNLLYRTWIKTAKMTRTVALSRRLSAIVLGSSAALALIAVSVSPTRAEVACMINGEPITNFDIEQRY